MGLKRRYGNFREKSVAPTLNQETKTKCPTSVRQNLTSQNDFISSNDDAKEVLWFTLSPR